VAAADVSGAIPFRLLRMNSATAWKPLSTDLTLFNVYTSAIQASEPAPLSTPFPYPYLYQAVRASGPRKQSLKPLTAQDHRLVPFSILKGQSHPILSSFLSCEQQTPMKASQSLTANVSVEQKTCGSISW
jgi:hypothetical protein